MNPKSPSFGFLVFLVVVVVVVAGAGAGYLYLHDHPKSISSPAVVRVGDNVTVNYIGLFGSGPEIGRVFDTSLKAVADNNATYPKSLEYSPRNASGYTPLPVHVGPRAPKGGYTINGTTYGTVVTGFWKGLIGLPLNQSRTLTIPPDQAYGSLNASCLKSSPLTQSAPVVVSYAPGAFAKAYVGVSAVKGTTFTDPTYGWSDRVLSSNSTDIVVVRQPSVGEVIDPYGWSIEVTGVTSTTITMTSQLTPSSVGAVLGNIANSTVCSTTKFLVWSVDLASGVFTMNYNREVAGETLVFVVTVVAIVPS
ncbi:MAG TPA: hypothetical protein VMH49_01365 [Thermoplasmata archaeon]|nr:hypothetical protein [Thermoplasmata archaeon]